MSLRRRVMVQGGGDAGFFEVIDLILDNTTARTPGISPSDMSFDNYLVQYSVVETGDVSRRSFDNG